MTTRLAALVSALAVGLAVGVSGCEDNRASIQIQAVCAPTDDCTFSNTCEFQYIGVPTLDLSASASDALTLFLQVENQLLDNSNPANGRLNTNDAHVDELIIEHVAIGEVVMGTNINIPAESSTLVAVDVIPPGYSALLASFVNGELLVDVRLGGYLDDGTRFETGDFPVTVRICMGCLGTCGTATCPPGRDGQAPIACATP